MVNAQIWRLSPPPDFALAIQSFDDTGDPPIEAAGRPTLIDLGTLGEQNSFAYALNDQGQVVGESSASPDGAQRAFSDQERDWFYGALADLAAWLVRNGINVLIAATANRRAYRQRARQQIDRFGEVYVRCALATCQRRDPKGIYRRAATGATHHVPGLDATFEPPLQPEAAVDTDQSAPEASAAAVLQQVAGFLGLQDASPPNLTT